MIHPETLNIEGIHHDAISLMCNEARQQTWQAIEDISKLIEPGMSEKQAIALANKLFADRGVKKFWHRTHIRFGKNTVLSFNDPYENEVILKENDIFYIDVGPVWEGVEGDCGKSYVFGEDPHKLQIIEAVEELYDYLKAYWQEENPSGQELMQVAEKECKKMGYLLHPSYVKGHRLSEFSHSQYTKNSLYDLTQTPAPARWVLECQICHPNMEFGAFYEDLLV